MNMNSEALDLESDTTLTTTDLETNEGKVILSNTINKEIDKIFGPAVQRNRSGSDIEIIGPFRRRHYWSQERLFSDKPQRHNQVADISNQLNSFQIDELKSLESKGPQTSVLHENQRAEIVASVTERLYSKLRKNEKNVSKIESVLEKKAIQPLSELKICSNARQRLMELSQKALRNKRRIGIPAYTQTRSQVTRVKNQGVDIQTDLQSVIDLSQQKYYSLRKDASIQTEPMIARLKEKAVGSKYDIINYNNKDTATQTNVACFKDNMTTTHAVNKSNNSTQTIHFPQTKRKNSTLSSKICENKIDSHAYKDTNMPYIHINISPIYSHSSKDSSDGEFFTEDESESLNDDVLIFQCKNKLANTTELKEFSMSESDVQNEFSDDECLLPQVHVDPTRNVDINDYEELILGRNVDTYPNNVKLSPCKTLDENKKRVIKFKEDRLVPDAAGDNNVTNTKKSCTKSHLILPVSGNSHEHVTDKTESIRGIRQNTNQNCPSNLENDDEEASYCDNIELYDRNTIEDCSPILFRKEFYADEFDSDTPLYYSLNSFFKTRHKKRTPTEYLHYLIQKRREAISIGYSRFYQRNISF